MSEKFRYVSPEVATIITRKKSLYCRASDTHQWDLFDQVALPNAKYEFTEGGKVLIQGGFKCSWDTTAAFVEFFSAPFETMRTMHLIGPGEMEQVSDDEVKAIFPLAYFSSPKANAAETDARGVQGMGAGHYYETYRRKGDDWFLETSRFDKLYDNQA